MAEPREQAAVAYALASAMRDPGLRQITRGFGAKTRAAGVLVFLVPLGIALSAVLPSGAAGPLEVLVFLTLPAIVTLATFWRWGLVVDPKAGTLTHWRGFAIFLVRTVYPLASIAHVGLLKEVRTTSKGTQIWYEVRLKRRQGSDLRLLREPDLQRTRLEAEAFAKLLRVDLHDASSDEPVVRQAAFLDESLSRRHRRLGLAAPYPPPPRGAVARLRYGGRGATSVIEIPAAGFRATYLVPALAMLVTAAVIVLGVAVMEGGDADRLGRWFLLFLIAGPVMLALAANLVTDATWRETITVSPAGIEIVSGSVLRRTTHFVGAEEIEEISAPITLPGVTGTDIGAAQISAVFHPATQVVVRTDRGGVPVGRSLPKSERAWLRDMLVHGLAGGDLPTQGARGERVGSMPRQSPSVASATAGRPTSSRTWAPWLLVAAVLAAIALGSGVLRTTVGEPPEGARPQGPALAGYELTPGPGSGFIGIYGRGVRAKPSERDLHVAIDEVRLVATDRNASTRFRHLSLSVHRRVEGHWRLVGHTEQKDVEAELPPGGTFTYPGAQEFFVEGAAETCLREPCYFRVHVIGRVGSNRPGWDVTDLMALKLQ